MIQRQQTLWLILATITAFLSFQFPFVTGKETVANSSALQETVIDAGSNMFFVIAYRSFNCTFFNYYFSV